jgi:hypothetical protein
MHLRERYCSLFSIETERPKLDVAGSSPVSRSIYFQHVKARRALPVSLNQPPFPPVGVKGWVGFELS